MINTSLCYITKNDMVLLLHRTKKHCDVNEGKWIGVGGKFLEGESPEECVCRETLEETGLTLTQYRYRGIVTFTSTGWEGEYMHLFTADGFTGQLTDCREGELSWIPQAHMRRLPTWEGDRIFLTLLERDTPFFSLKLSYDGDRLTHAALNGCALSLPFDAASLPKSHKTSPV